jgi:hypothetical protein
MLVGKAQLLLGGERLLLLRESSMDNEVEHRIRERAYQLWVQDGQVPGRAQEYWLRAERELLGTPNEGIRTGGMSGPVPVADRAVGVGSALKAKSAPKRPAAKGAKSSKSGTKPAS